MRRVAWRLTPSLRRLPNTQAPFDGTALSNCNKARIASSWSAQIPASSWSSRGEHSSWSQNTSVCPAPAPPAPAPPHPAGTLFVQPGSGTLQAAYYAAPWGGVLILADGTYTAGGHNVLQIGKAITIRALNPGSAILDGEGERPVILISGGDVVLEGLLIVRGSGGGITALTGSLALRSNVFEGNDASSGGCAVHIDAIDDTSSVLFNNTFRVSSCASQALLVINSAVPIPCELGTYMSPTPLSLPPTRHTFTDCAFACPPGTFGNAPNLTDAGCSGACPVGHYCPARTAHPIPCPVGTYLNTEGGAVLGSCLRAFQARTAT